MLQLEVQALLNEALGGKYESNKIIQKSFTEYIIYRWQHGKKTCTREKRETKQAGACKDKTETTIRN